LLLLLNNASLGLFLVVGIPSVVASAVVTLLEELLVGLVERQALHYYFLFLSREGPCIALPCVDKLPLKIGLEPIRVARQTVGRPRELCKELSNSVILDNQV
jgi:hypothetical protein